jgi:hypothetical protein
VIGDRRARDAPPVDSLAEAIVLNYLLLNREMIEATDLSRALVFPEHRWCWQAMLTVQQRAPDLSFGAFYLALIDELERSHPGQGFALVELLRVSDTEHERGWDEYRRANRDDLGRRDFHHGFSWWLARLRTISDLRQTIRASSEAAECAWREDLAGARRALSAVPRAGVVRVEV